MSGIYWFLKHFIFIIICTVLAFIILISFTDVKAGIFGRDKIPYNMAVGDTVIVKVPEKEHAVICFDSLHEGELFDCYIIKINDFLKCIDDSYVERKPEPTPTPTAIPFEDINKPKE